MASNTSKKSSWQNSLDKVGFIHNAMYDYILQTFPIKVFKEGITDIKELYVIYTRELWELGERLGWSPDRIHEGLVNYGLKNLRNFIKWNEEFLS